MKKFTLALFALLSMTYMAKAQQYVSTEPANRNVILEEFTGRSCGYCTDGHRVANQIMAANPGRVWAINIHAGGYALTSYPNMITTDGNTIHGGFTISGYPTGVVNRSTANGIDRGQWAGQASTQMGQTAECNVAGVAMINPDTRVATITVEVYYTGNSTISENYLTVAMLQDSILGSQADYGNYNPTQWLNGQYVHMHILRDCITPAWGEPISPTTQGTLITKTYEYPIPESIGSPNGVDVDINNIFFLAWVSERQQGNAYRPILTGCELEKTTMTSEPIYPSISNISQAVGASCSHTQSFHFGLSNIGTETITSMRYLVEVGELSEEFEWTGELVSGDKTNVDFDMDIDFGTYQGTINITEVNGEAYENNAYVFAAECMEWAEIEEEGDETNIKILIVQDQWGEQITWNLMNSAGEVVAQGGPYSHLMGSGSTQPNIANLTVSTNECYLFTINDSNGNGICCNYGNGYYEIRDSHNHAFIEGAGDYGEMAQHKFSIHKQGDAVVENPASGLVVYPNPANSKIFVEGDEIGAVEIYNSLGQRLTTVEGTENTTVDVASYENGVYVVRVISNDGNVTTKKVTIAH